MARKPHEPTAANRSIVESMAAYGVPQFDIARVLSISVDTLAKYYREELDTAATRANSQVANNLFKLATKNDFKAIPAAIFWLKTRAGWSMSEGEFDGKKKQAEEAAKTAGLGTDWGADLSAPASAGASGSRTH